jgi:hypothetical protein
MKIDRFTIQRAQSLNNFQPGGKEWWIVCLHGDEKKPCLFETLEGACQWIQSLANPQPPQYRQIAKMEETWQHN